MSNDLTDKDPFAEDEEEDKVDLISEAMVKKATWLIHKLAEQRKQDFKEIQKKCKKKFAYTNLAKISMEEGHAIIDTLIELTGGEEEQERAEQKETGEDDLSRKTETKEEPTEEREADDLQSEIGKLAEMLRICVGNSREIVAREMSTENITEGTRAILVKSFSATLFIEASKRGLGR